MYGTEYFLVSYYNAIVITISFLVMIVGSITDFQKREVADWINYGFFFSAIAIRLIFALVNGDYMIIVDGLFGFLAFTILGLMMFYLGQWGGGDAKMIIGLGTLFGLKLIPFDLFGIMNSLLIAFILNSMLFGSLYGMVWSAILSIKNWKRFIKEWIKVSSESKYPKIMFMTCGLLMMGSSMIFKEMWMLLIPLGLMTMVMFYAFIFTKSIEKGCMIVSMPLSKMTEGEWVAQDVIVKGKYITGPKDLGISNEQIAKLKMLGVRKIDVKIGIPFVPAFLLGFAATFFFGNIITYALSLMI